MRDPHDPREFRQWVSLDDLGNVIAVHEFAADVQQPLPEIVEVTALGQRDWSVQSADVLAPIRLERSILVAEVAAAELIAADQAAAMAASENAVK